MKKMFWIMILFLSFIVPFNVEAVDLKMTYDKNIEMYGNVDIFPSYDDSGKIDGTLFLNDNLIKYNFNDELVFKKESSDLDSDFEVELSNITIDNNLGYTVKGDSDILISVTNINTLEKVFVKQYGGNGFEEGITWVKSYDNNGVQDGYLILLVSKSDDLGITPGYIVLKYDLKGNLIWQKNLNDYFSHDFTIFTVDGKINSVFTTMGDIWPLILKTDANNTESLKIDPGLKIINNITLSYAKSGVVDGIIVVGNVTDSNRNLHGVIVKYDLDGNEVFRHKYARPSFYTSTISSKYVDGSYDGYIVTGCSNEGTIVLKYDYDGNIVYKDIYSKDKYYRFNRILNNYDSNGKQNGYILVSNYVNDDKNFFIEPSSFNFKLQKPKIKKLGNIQKLDIDYSQSVIVVKYTYPFYDVVKDKTDVGEINVSNDNAYPGEVVKVSVTPKEGYTLKRIVVKDESGKEIEVSKDGTFIMPEGKVTVTAIYNRISNPETVSACYVVLGIILLISIGTLIVQKKKEIV